MDFIADKQTLEDLNIQGKYRANSMYSIFNQVRTNGGQQLLDQMFRHPMTDADAINQRSSTFRYFQEKGLAFPFRAVQFSVMESYLVSGGGQGWGTNFLQTARRRVLKAMGLQQEYTLFNNGFHVTVTLLRQLKTFLNALQLQDPLNPFHQEIAAFHKIYDHPRLAWLGKPVQTDAPSLVRMASFDHLLRNVFHEEMKAVLQLVYRIDVSIAVAGVAAAKGFVYARALPADEHVIAIRDCRHPGLEKAIGNSIILQHDKNVLFLTGANMAGKSTFMKSFGIAVYMAHMGFPVAAAEMEFSVKHGIYSSINVPDDLEMGYSHFYAEVLRVKKVATEVGSGKNLVVIFDELFKGTNVKDAYDATLAVSQGFARYRNCAFIISTHIIEVGEVLREKCDNLELAYLPTVMKGMTPTYTYTLEPGITSDRHGMMIIENERILEIITS
jgi:DNA mismatch repair ATPase MutS